jgi:hypothetical protein
MSLYDLHDATFDETEGQGYAYSEKTVYGKAYKGVFFFENGAADTEELAVDAEDDEEETEYEFSGILYDRSREREKTFPVRVDDVINTPSGARVDFIATEKP